MKKHFVVFLSPGTFCSEKTSKEIESWDIEKAKQMSKDIVERYGSHPFCFYFTTMSNDDDNWSPKQIDKSGRYYINGKVRTFEEVVKDNFHDEESLRLNMKYNEWDKVVTTFTPWKNVQPFEDGDQIVEINVSYD